MPLYVFRCPTGHETELERPVARASEPIRCPECGDEAQRLYRLRGIGFKGSGFHNTDDGSTTFWFGDGIARNILN